MHISALGNFAWRYRLWSPRTAFGSQGWPSVLYCIILSFLCTTMFCHLKECLWLGRVHILSPGPSSQYSSASRMPGQVPGNQIHPDNPKPPKVFNLASPKLFFLPCLAFPEETPISGSLNAHPLIIRLLTTPVYLSRGCPCEPPASRTWAYNHLGFPEFSSVSSCGCTNWPSP